MSITTKLATVAFAATIASFAISSALANTKGPSGPPHRSPIAGGAATQGSNHHMYPPHRAKYTLHCYYLPTVSNGSVSGLRKVCTGQYK